MSDDPSERFQNGIQENTEAARTTLIGHHLASDGDWNVKQSRDGGLIWVRPVPGGYAWISNARRGLGETLEEPYFWGIRDETHDHSVDCGGGLAPNLDEALRCVGDPTEWERALLADLAGKGEENTTHGQHRIAALSRLRRLRDHVPPMLDESITIAPEDLRRQIESSIETQDKRRWQAKQPGK